MLFFCSWADRASLLVDALDEKDASAVAAAVADGRAPARLVPLAPRAFVAEVFVDADDDEDEGPLVVEPLPHVEELLSTLEGEDAPGPAAAAALECGSESESEDGDVFVCELDADHGGEHESRDESGRIVATWEG